MADKIKVDRALRYAKKLLKQEQAIDDGSLVDCLNDKFFLLKDEINLVEKGLEDAGYSRATGLWVKG
jgi:hypothetical protein